MCTEADDAVDAHPHQFHVQLYVLTPAELEARRRGAWDGIHFAGKRYRILWGNTRVPGDFAAAPRQVQSLAEAAPDHVAGAPWSIPRAYFGTVSREGKVDKWVDVATSGRTVLQIGEVVDRAPETYLDPVDWLLDRASLTELDGKYFVPRVLIPLQSAPAPTGDDEDWRAGELWWRLWNLGMIDEAPGATHAASAAATSTLYSLRDMAVYHRSVDIAKRRWNHVRSLIDATAPDDGHVALLADLLQHHDRIP